MILPDDLVHSGQTVEIILVLPTIHFANLPRSLDSRHRKKKHTEELEEKKLYTKRNHMLEEEVKKLQMQLNNLTMEKEELMHLNNQLSQQAKKLACEKERLVEDHTLETTDLRKRISLLTEQSESSPQLLPSQPINEFSEFMNEMDPIGQEHFDWDSFIIVDDVAMDLDQGKECSC
jgi:hypothetical protein